MIIRPPARLRYLIAQQAVLLGLIAMSILTISSSLVASEKIHTTFTGNSNPKGNSVTVDIYLYDATAGNVEVASYSLGSATAWSGQGVSWYNLNTSHYYYFKIVKSVGSARLVFTLDCIAQNW